MSTTNQHLRLHLLPLSERRIDLLLEKRKSETPDKLFLAFPEEKLELTFAEAAAAAQQYGGFLRVLGLKAGDHLG
jgi:hypothetical protein